jgi:hypothetical protein
MDSIRIDTGVKKILINDGPEYIEFNPSDVSFAERFENLISEFETKLIEYQARSDEIEANQELDDHGIPVNLDARLKLMRDVCEFIRERIDHIFGAGTSQKVFGSALSLDMFTQFFEGITPFIKRDRLAKVAKYQKQPRKQVMK